MKKFSFTEFQDKARELYGDNNYYPGDRSPLDFLYSAGWDMTTGPAFAEEKVAKINTSLSDNSCFGRTLRAIVLLEKYFPQEKIFYGEVQEDLLRNILMNEASPRKWEDVSFIQEIIQYEAPHAVVVFEDGSQFDPLFKYLCLLPNKLKHPRVSSYEPWGALYASYLVSHGYLIHEKTGRADLYLEILQEAQTYCPEMLMIKENMSSVLLLLGRDKEAIELAESVLGKRQDVNLYFFLWFLTKKEEYKEHIIKEYDQKMFELLTKNIQT